MSDPIVEEVRKARDEYARRFNYDLQAICADLRRQQALGEGPIVSFPKRPIRVAGHRKPRQPVSTGSNTETDS